MADEFAGIVVNKHRNSAAAGKMGQAFGHAARVLKPGGRAVLAFADSDDQVWGSIQKALREAGRGSRRR